MHGEEINEDVIRQRLQVAVKRVERVRRERRRDYEGDAGSVSRDWYERWKEGLTEPFVVGLV